jgi:CheY-like chemotaxis protein
MDVGMPRLNGYEATRRIRERPWGRDVAIIALTGWGQEVDRARSKEAGCDGHLVKPVDLPELEKLLSQLLGEGVSMQGQPQS